MGMQNIIIEMTQEFALVQKDQVDDLIETYLERGGQDLKANRGGLIVFNHQVSNMTWLVEWVKKGDSLKHTCKRKKVADYPWMMNHFKEYRGFICNPETWSEESRAERDLFTIWYCPALICSPVYQNELKGFCFWGRGEARTWGKNEELALKQVGLNPATLL